MRRYLIPRKKIRIQLPENFFLEDDHPATCAALGCTRQASHRDKSCGVPICAVDLTEVQAGKTVIFEIGEMHYMFGSDAMFRRIR